MATLSRFIQLWEQTVLRMMTNDCSFVLLVNLCRSLEGIQRAGRKPLDTMKLRVTIRRGNQWMHLANGGKDHVNSTKQNLKVTILKNCLSLRYLIWKTGKTAKSCDFPGLLFLGVRRNPRKSASGLFFTSITYLLAVFPRWHLASWVGRWDSAPEVAVGTLKLGTAGSWLTGASLTTPPPSLTNTFTPWIPRQR